MVGILLAVLAHPRYIHKDNQAQYQQYLLALYGALLRLLSIDWLHKS